MVLFLLLQADFELAPDEKRLTKAQQIYEKYLQPGVSDYKKVMGVGGFHVDHTQIVLGSHKIGHIYLGKICSHIYSSSRLKKRYF